MSTVVKKTIKLTLNGEPITAPEGTVILDAAKREGVFISNLCSSPKLKPFAACRTCMVETVIDGKKELVHMNDATAFAIGRILIAILENYQQKDGSIIIPKVLRKYMPGNIEKISKKD